MAGGNFLKKNVKTGISRKGIHVIFWYKKEEESITIDSMFKGTSYLSKLSRKKLCCLLLAPGTGITDREC